MYSFGRPRSVPEAAPPCRVIVYLAICWPHSCMHSTLSYKHCQSLADLHWQMPGARPPPPKGPDSFVWHTKVSKHNCLGSPRPPPTRSTPPYGKSWIRHCQLIFIIHNRSSLHGGWTSRSEISKMSLCLVVPHNFWWQIVKILHKDFHSFQKSITVCRLTHAHSDITRLATTVQEHHPSFSEYCCVRWILKLGNNTILKKS